MNILRLAEKEMQLNVSGGFRLWRLVGLSVYTTLRYTTILYFKAFCSLR